MSSHKKSAELSAEELASEYSDDAINGDGFVPVNSEDVWFSVFAIEKAFLAGHASRDAEIKALVDALESCECKCKFNSRDYDPMAMSRIGNIIEKTFTCHRCQTLAKHRASTGEKGEE